MAMYYKADTVRSLKSQLFLRNLRVLESYLTGLLVWRFNYCHWRGKMPTLASQAIRRSTIGRCGYLRSVRCQFCSPWACSA